MSDISISKVKLIKQGEKLELGLQELGAVASEGARTFKNHVHPDLLKAMNGLKCHFAILTDYLTEKQAMDKDELEKFVIYGYSIKGKEGQEGIVITGGRKTRRGKILTINTEFLRLDVESDDYYLIADLNAKIVAIEAEVELYIGGKQAQLSIDFPEDKKPEKEKVTKAQIDHPEEAYAGTKDAMPPTTPVVNMKDKEKKGKTTRKVAQSADVPSGELAVNE